MYTFAIWTCIVNVYIILYPPFIDFIHHLFAGSTEYNIYCWCQVCCQQVWTRGKKHFCKGWRSFLHHHFLLQLHDSFFQVPLTGPAAQNFKSVNVREHNMLGQVLPELQHFIETNCTGQTNKINNTTTNILLQFYYV